MQDPNAASQPFAFNLHAHDGAEDTSHVNAEIPADALAAAAASWEAEKADMQDRLLRALADVENMRRRSEKEVRDAQVYGVTKMATDMLGIADNLSRALTLVTEEAKAGADPVLAGFIEGVDMVAREMMRVFERYGVREITAKGEKFDPNLHQAMLEVSSNDIPAGHVVDVLQTGYMIGERVLRPAFVSVCKAS